MPQARNMGARRVLNAGQARGALLVAACACAMVAASVMTSPALAKPARVYAGTIGAADSTPSNPYPLVDPGAEAADMPRSIAVDDSSGPSSHDIYVADAAAHRIEKFSPSGELLLMFGKQVNETAVEAHAGAYEENVCVIGSGDLCQAGSAGTEPGAFSNSDLLLVAVDSSSGASAGDVYVGDGGNDKVSKFDPEGHLIASWGVSGQLDGSSVISPPATQPGPFGALYGLYVDESGHLWVEGTAPPTEIRLEKPALFEFGQAGSFMTDWVAEELLEDLGGFAIDGEGNVYIGSGLVKYSASGAFVQNIVPHLLGAQSVAFDAASQSLYSVSYQREIERYPLSCEDVYGGCPPIESFGAGDLRSARGIAVDSGSAEDTLYVGEKEPAAVALFAVKQLPDVMTAPAGDVSIESAVLQGTVDPVGEAVTKCVFEWGLAGTGYEHTVPCTPDAAEIGAAEQPVNVHANVSGLQAGRSYHFRLSAADVWGSENGDDVTFGPPRVEGESIVSASAESVVVQMEVDPQNLATSVAVEYGTGGSYSAVTPEVNIGAAGQQQVASLTLTGLSPGATYDYRVVAQNLLGVTDGAEQQVVTQRLGVFELPDGRQWELVSPPEKYGALLTASEETGVIQAAANGEAITYLATAPTEANPSGNSNLTQVLSTRTPAGWISEDINLTHAAPTQLSGSGGQEFRFFSPDLKQAIVQPLGSFDQADSPEATEQTPFLRSNYVGSATPCHEGCLRPLVTAANVPAGTAFGVTSRQGTPCTEGNTLCGPQFVGATSDLSHVIVESQVPLTSTPKDEGGLYEWFKGALSIVSVLPSGKPAKTWQLGSRGASNAALAVMRHAVAADGTRIAWSEGEGGSKHLYLRDTVTEQTLQLDKVQGGTAAGAAEASFDDASPDGSRVYFTDTQRLTANAGAEASAPDLYECQIVEEEGSASCDLSDLTPAGAPEGIHGVVGTTLGAAEDGSDVYFVANARERGDGCLNIATSHNTTCGLYMWHEGEVRLIAVLAGTDAADWALPGLQTAVVSPDGRWLAFMSRRPLTGYDNRDLRTGERDEEVFLYDAAASGGAGRLICASCDPSGARPLGEPMPEGRTLALAAEVWAVGTPIAASLPAWSWWGNLIGDGALQQPRLLSDSGRLFFDSHDALVSQDTNGVEDVYEYEPEGVGTCKTVSQAFSAVSDGCANLISSGTSPRESAFLDASEAGGDAFFLTASVLSSADVDNAYDVYDAHECGVGAPCTAAVGRVSQQCEGESCQGAPPTVVEVTPSSLTFVGAGNVVPSRASNKPAKAGHRHASRKRALAVALKGCRRQASRRRREKCDRAVRRRYGGRTKRAGRPVNVNSRETHRRGRRK